jgi:crossover junction endodeoxyribonuclease RuvC
MKIVLGVDPGLSGGAALLSMDRKFVQVMAFAKLTTTEIADWITKYKIDHAFLEGVNAMPKQGVSSTFKFGTNYGFWQGILAANKIPFERVYPLKWQTYLNCRTGGNKNISKARAQELFPDLTITHALADALLIAEYGRRKINAVEL